MDQTPPSKHFNMFRVILHLARFFGTFVPVLVVCLFGLSCLVFVSWLSGVPPTTFVDANPRTGLSQVFHPVRDSVSQ